MTESAPLNGKKILCIEDEYFISELYRRALSKAGYEVTVELDGAKGLELAKTDQFDVILLDIMIPSLTGTDILRALKSSDPLKAKIIITTNLEQGDEARNEIEQQADGYVVKANVTPRELVAIIQSIG